MRLGAATAIRVAKDLNNRHEKRRMTKARKDTSTTTTPKATSARAARSPRARGADERQALLELLRTRFERHGARHAGTPWSDVEARLTAHPDKLWSLAAMEDTGGEPDVVGKDASGALIFMDCAPESPAGRRSICYDRAALDARKENKPRSSAQQMAEEMGIELLDEAQYRQLQTLGVFDAKTSSWVKTPDAIRKLGGALFCDCRYGTVFTYHNGAESYYAARGFRGALRV